MRKIYALLNTAIIFAVIYWNYWVNTRPINGNTMGGLSAEYANLFTPAGYAFSIWGIIFIGLLAYSFNQIRLAFFDVKHANSIDQTGFWLALANLGSMLWIALWLYEYTGLSVLCMVFIMASLLKLTFNLDLENWDSPISVIVLVWWPITIYLGWISVATIANISAWLAKIGWAFLFSELQWTIIMISVAALLNLFMLFNRNMREFIGVGIWAILAIAIRHWETIPFIKWVCLTWIFILAIAAFYHGFINRKTNPFYQKFVPKQFQF